MPGMVDRVGRTGRRMTLADEVHENIRFRIVDHHLAAGARLNIDALAGELGVSATPVREALARLASEGLTSYEPLVGYRVEPPLDADAFDQLMEARMVLEPPIAELAATRRTDGDIAALGDWRRKQDRGNAGLDRVRIAADVEFHQLVARCAHNAFLATALEDLRAHLHIYRLHNPVDSAEDTNVEHWAIRDAIVVGDGDSAADAMRKHLERSYIRHAQGLRSDDSG
jgi:DNA-binding GntR family transcriptional regulator